MTTAKQNTKTTTTAPAFIGIDLTKNSVHIHGVDRSGRTCSDQKLKPAKLKTFLATLKPCVVGMEERVTRCDQMIEAMAREDERAQLLMTIPGVGPMTATALLSTMGDPGVFRNGRECAAC